MQIRIFQLNNLFRTWRIETKIMQKYINYRLSKEVNNKNYFIEIVFTNICDS